MDQQKPISTRLLEDNIPLNFRAVFYILPLFISWLPGILYERDTVTLPAAKRGFFIFASFLFVTGILYFSKGALLYIANFQGPAIHYIYYGLSILTSLGYLFISLYSAFLEWKSLPPIKGVASWSSKLERYLQR